MPERTPNYSKRELDAKFLNIEEKLDVHFEATGTMLSEIKAQTTKTNGRVTKLEKMFLVMATALIVLLATQNPVVAHLFGVFLGL